MEHATPVAVHNCTLHSPCAAHASMSHSGAKCRALCCACKAPPLHTSAVMTLVMPAATETQHPTSRAVACVKLLVLCTIQCRSTQPQTDMHTHVTHTCFPSSHTQGRLQFTTGLVQLTDSRNTRPQGLASCCSLSIVPCRLTARLIKQAPF